MNFHKIVWTYCLSFAGLSLLLVAPLAAHADAYADLSRAKAAFEAVHSWHAVEQMSNGHTVTVDHVAPDRWRIQVMPNMAEIMIGNDLYMVRNGQSMHMPMVMPQIQQIVNQNWLTVDPEVKRTARDLGMQTMNGVRLHAYSFTSKDMPVKLYLSRNHLPAVAVVTSSNGSVTITYSDYNSAITINPQTRTVRKRTLQDNGGGIYAYRLFVGAEGENKRGFYKPYPHG